MTEEDLKKAILEKVQKEKEALLNQARQEADEILKQARLEATSLKETNLTEIKKRCLLKGTKDLNQINLEAKRQLLEAKEKKILEVLSLVEGNLKAIQKDRGHYKSIFKSLLRESQETLDKKAGLKLKVNPSDRELASDVLRELKIEAQIETKESVNLGLELCDSKENIIVLNTFESRLNKLLPELRQEISKIIDL